MIYTIRKLGLTANLRVCLDAGDDASYSSGQSWLDTSGNGYDFFRGADGSATATDPTFNGTAGRRSSSEYWSFDGGDYFTYDTTNETWMQNIHKDNAIATIVGWVYFGSTGAVHRMCGSVGSGAFGSAIGHTLQTTTGNVVQWAIGNATGGGGLIAAMTATFAVGWHFVAASLNEATGANGLTLQLDGVQESFTSTYTSPSASNASATMQIAAGGGGGSPIANGDRMAAFLAWEGRRLTDAELLTLYMATRGRFGV